LTRVDFNPSHRQPQAACVILALAVSLAGSLAADAILVVIGTTLFFSTKDYDYAKLTIIGVVIACLAWPVVIRISSAPRWLFSSWRCWSRWCSGSRTSTSWTWASRAARSRC